MGVLSEPWEGLLESVQEPFRLDPSIAAGTILGSPSGVTEVVVGGLAGALFEWGVPEYGAKR